LAIVLKTKCVPIINRYLTLKMCAQRRINRPNGEILLNLVTLAGGPAKGKNDKAASKLENYLVPLAASVPLVASVQADICGNSCTKNKNKCGPQT
jgi:hypothetical protein